MKRNVITYKEGGHNPDAPDGNVLEQVRSVELGLSADRYTIPADGITASTLHWAGYEQVATWDINGQESVEAAIFDPASGLWVSELEVVSSTPGDIEVSCNGDELELEVKSA